MLAPAKAGRKPAAVRSEPAAETTAEAKESHVDPAQTILAIVRTLAGLEQRLQSGRSVTATSCPFSELLEKANQQLAEARQTIWAMGGLAMEGLNDDERPIFDELAGIGEPVYIPGDGQANTVKPEIHPGALVQTDHGTVAVVVSRIDNAIILRAIGNDDQNEHGEHFTWGIDQTYAAPIEGGKGGAL